MVDMKSFWLVVGIGVASELLYHIYRRLVNKNNPSKRKNIFPACEVLFFPDRGQLQGTATSSQDSNQINKNLADPPTVALQKIVAFLRCAKSSLDLAVFTFTCQQLADEVLNLHKQGIRIRFIGDQNQALAEDSQVERLRSAGVAVRCHSSNFLMHHKFAVVDGKRLLCGSLNWTRNGVWGNYENVLISSDPGLVTPFLKEFSSLWDEFNPTKVTG